MLMIYVIKKIRYLSNISKKYEESLVWLILLILSINLVTYSSNQVPVAVLDSGMDMRKT